MSEKTWKLGMAISVDPNSTLDFEFDFEDWLDTEQMVGCTLTPVNCNVVQRSISETGIVFRASAFQEGAKVTARPTSLSGRVDDFTVGFRLVQQ